MVLIDNREVVVQELRHCHLILTLIRVVFFRHQVVVELVGRGKAGSHEDEPELEGVGAKFYADRGDRFVRAFEKANERTEGYYTPCFMTTFCEPHAGRSLSCVVRAERLSSERARRCSQALLAV